MQCDLGLLATAANNCSFGSSSSRNIALQATGCWNTISRSAGGFRRTQTRAFRKWQSVICNRTYYVEASLRQRAAVRAQLHDQKPMNQDAMNQNDDVMLPRPVRDSQSEMAEIVLPNDANPLGALLGGRLMHWIDLAGAMAAHRHARNYVVTAAIDHMDFWVPVHVGDLVILRSSVNRVFRTSMEVGVKTWVENYIEDDCKHVGSAYLTFVAIDASGRRLQVPAVIPETEDQRRRYDDAGRRREIRRAERERRRNNVRS
jgi:acyl-CoA hydrolase